MVAGRLQVKTVVLAAVLATAALAVLEHQAKETQGGQGLHGMAAVVVVKALLGGTLFLKVQVVLVV